MNVLTVLTSRALRLLLVAASGALLLGALGQSPQPAPDAPLPTPRFTHIDVYLDSADKLLAAYQVELKADMSANQLDMRSLLNVPGLSLGALEGAWQHLGYGEKDLGVLAVDAVTPKS